MTVQAAADDTLSETPCLRSYDCHGLHLQIVCPPTLAPVLHARLRGLPEASDESPALRFEFSLVPDVASHRVKPPPGPTRPVYHSPMGEVRYADAADALYISCDDRIRLICLPAEGTARISILQDAADELWLISHPMLTFPLLECLKRHGRYSLHAAGLVHAGRAVLFPAPSGAGKSTLTLSLLRAGFGFLGDDLLFVEGEPGRPQVLAFPDEIDVTEATLQFFPELQDVVATPRPSGWPKHQIRADERFRVPVVRQCPPAALVFPAIASTARSVIRPMDPDEALLELVPNVLLTDPCSAQAHLDALAGLAGSCACYRLSTGRDFDALPALVRGLLE